MFLVVYCNSFPDAELPDIRKKIYEASDEQWEKIKAIQLKNPTIALLLSILLGGYGVDRFYLGQILLGIGKVLLWGLLFLSSIINFFISFNGDDISSDYLLQLSGATEWAPSGIISLTVGSLLFFACMIWYIADIFLVMKTAKRMNLKALLDVLT